MTSYFGQYQRSSVLRRISHVLASRESDAILLYLIEKYDPEHKISVESFEDRMYVYQWLIFQASGQGYVSFLPSAHRTLMARFYRPPFGQCGWFKAIGPPPRIPVAIERYQKEILRVFGVLESVLSKQEWLVGGKCTIADLSFIM